MRIKRIYGLVDMWEIAIFRGKYAILKQFAKENNLTIVTKDADFSDLVLLNNPPPRVIHIKLGNMKMKAFHSAIDTIWNEVLMMSKEYKLVRVYKDKIEGIG